MPIDPQAQSFLDGMIAAGGPPLHLSTVEEARAVPEMFPEILGPGPDCLHVRDVAIPGPAGDITARIYEPVDDPPATLVYWHGGGWVLGSAAAWDACVRSLAKESGCRIVSADYRLAPEHPYPAAVDDAYAATVLGGAGVPRARSPSAATVRAATSPPSSASAPATRAARRSRTSR